MMMKRQMLHIAFFFFTLTALTGVWLRLYVFSDAVKITDYPYILHGHSHIAVLGWTFFSAFLLLVFFLGQASSNYVSVLIGLLVVVTIPMFVAFLIQGYALYSIIFSTLHIFVQYLVAYFVIKHTRKNDAVPGVIRRFIYGAIVMLIISSIGPFALGAIAAKDRKSTRLNSSHVKISYAVFCLNVVPSTVIHSLSLHDALPISLFDHFFHTAHFRPILGGVFRHQAYEKKRRGSRRHSPFHLWRHRHAHHFVDRPFCPRCNRRQ